MPDPQKSQIVEELHEKFSRAKGAVLSDFKGMTVEQMTSLRKELRNNSVEFRVVKNTLAKRAMEGTSFSVLEDSFKGPVSIALSYEDSVTPAKVLTDFSKKEPKLKITAGFCEGKKVSEEEIKYLADLPSRDVLLGQILAVANGPARNFVGTLNGVLLSFLRVLSAVKDKK